MYATIPVPSMYFVIQANFSPTYAIIIYNYVKQTKG